jgi:hypothetical protein
MLTLRRGIQRRQKRHREQVVWLTFYPQDGPIRLADGFGALVILDEGLLPPGPGVLLGARGDAEMVTYVREGALGYRDSTGRSGVLLAGEFQWAACGRGVRHRQSNASRISWTRVFRIGLDPCDTGLERGDERKRFSLADRRGRLCVVASSDGRDGSLRLHQDALIYSALLHPGQHVVHELLQGRRAWLHLVQGDATLGDVALSTGDGAGITAERAISLTAWAETEILLFDLSGQLPRSRTRDSLS